MSEPIVKRALEPINIVGEIPVLQKSVREIAHHEGRSSTIDFSIYSIACFRQSLFLIF
jgi:hypothetical protein